MAEAVKVMVRARPMNKRERSLNAEKVIEVREDRKEIMIFNPEEPENKKTFTYDNVFNENSQQKDVYEKSAYSIVENMFEGYNGTIFAYGQTGCGKTFSMMGVTSDEVLKGIIPRSFSHIIARIADAKNKNFLLRCSFIEIYNENIHDLLSSDTTKNMDLRESKKKGIFIKDLNMPVVKTVEEMLKWMNQGDKNRHVGATKMNQDSSRSHSIFTVYLEVEEKIDAKNSKIKAGKLNLVDLAGSERQSKTEATGQRLKEATKINLSLSALGNVIAALVSGKKKHIPYRDSKLTRLLQDSLGGNTKTLMIAAISPADDNYDETLGTLKYANRAKQIKNKPKVNEDPKDALIREYQEELKRLKAQLGAGGGDPGAEPQIARMNTEDKAKLETMQQMKGKLEKNNQDMMDQMNDQERLLNEEKKKRKEMEQRLAAMQAAMVMGGQVKGITKEEKDDLKAMEENAAIREMNEKNEGNSEEAQKKEKTDDMELMTDDVDEMQRKYEELQKRFKQVNRDVRDEEYENAKEKADILETLRFQERELDFLRQVATMVMSDREMGKIKQMAKWDDDEDDYLVPFFYFKEQNDIKNLPSISINNGGAPAASPMFNGKGTSKDFRVSRGGNSSRLGTGNKNINASNSNQYKDVFDAFDNSTDSLNNNDFRINTGLSRGNEPNKYISTSSSINRMRKSIYQNNQPVSKTTKRVRPTNGKLAPINQNIFDSGSAMYENNSSTVSNSKRPKKYGRLKPMNM